MSLIGNILWLVFGGLLSGLGYIFGGLVLCLTIVGIPFGLQSIRIGRATFAPFGKEVREVPESGGILRILFDVLWIVFFGWEIALVHLAHAAFLALTIVGIPFAIQHVKLIPVSLLPFERELASKD